MRRSWTGAIALVWLGCAPQPEAEQTPAGAGSRPQVVGTAALDATLVDQDGHEVQLAELVAGKVAVMNAFFTSCEQICPMTAATLSAVADGLGPRLGTDIVMVSLSLDPTTDTPERLHAFATKHGGRPGWRFLTGDRVVLARLVDRLGLGAAVKEAHSPVLSFGAPGRTAWSRASGISDPAVVVGQILAVAEAR
jgi:protein SCO1/2